MMDSDPADSSSSSQPPPEKNPSIVEPPVIASNVESFDKGPTAEPSVPTGIMPDHSSEQSQSTSAESKDANTSLPEPRPPQDTMTADSSASTLSRITSGLSLRLSAMASGPEESAKGSATTGESGVFESLTKGIVDSSRSAVKAIQVKARHAVSQNKRRYQEGGFDLDMAYITENIIAMGFPAGDLSSGLFGFFEGFYRNHMEEVIRFFESHHKGKYKVYNLCSERLYDASRFEGKVACFPFDDHNCPPLQLIRLFCQSAYSWLKEDIENVVVVHCKAGMGRTGLMICSLLLYLKFFPTADEAIDVFNQKRCVDGKALVLPSQIRYVKYFDRVLTYFNGEIQPGRKCMLRGFRLNKCPYWIRPSITISNHSGVVFSTRKHPKTKDLMPEDFWISARKKGIVVFALPGEPGLTELVGDFKIQFHDRQGDFYCWLNTTMTENRKILKGDELDGFDKVTRRKLPSPGFEVEIVMIDYDGTSAAKTKVDSNTSGTNSSSDATENAGTVMKSNQKKMPEKEEDDVFSDSDEEETEVSKKKQQQGPGEAAQASSEMAKASAEQTTKLIQGREHMSQGQPNASKEQPNNAAQTQPSSTSLETPKAMESGVSDIKAMAADASVFTFGDEDEFDSD
ncbi:Phosphatidylinositol 3,4,5-trisphosphate 3-phosphatase and protein-tyrosine-phosphatase PTEN2A [Linum grandiflorum]